LRKRVCVMQLDGSLVKHWHSSFTGHPLWSFLIIYLMIYSCAPTIWMNIDKNMKELFTKPCRCTAVDEE
jgi:hypothetical protein